MFPLHKRFLRQLLPILALFVLSSCRGIDKPLKYLGDAESEYYKNVATQVDYPVLEEECDREPLYSEPPRRIRHPRKDELWDLGLHEVLVTALNNSRVLRTRGQFLSNSNPLFTNPNGVSTVYDPAIQESGVLFGTRGVEAALSDFDTQFTTTMLWGRNELVQNNAILSGGLPPGATLTEETGAFTSRLEKNFANGGIFAVNHNWNYSGNNVPTRLFQSLYTGVLQAEYRQPLWAGAGTEFSRIAGPIGRNLQGVSGVNQGVVIARINNDITIADFETDVQNLLKDLEDVYWNLVLAYRIYDIEVESRNRTLEIWRRVKANFDVNRASAADEAQSRDNYFENRARAENALADLYQTETDLRRLMGLPVNDGRIIRPVEEPIKGEFTPDWHVSLAESLTRRTELRKQKWNIKSLELQLKAARSLIRPRFDFVSNYRVNGFGDKLISTTDNDGATPQGFHNAYESLTQGNQTGWNLGFEVSMPLGQRQALAQVRNIELRLAKARRVLSVQEHEVSHELSTAFQLLDRTFMTAQTNLNRQLAAKRRVDAFIAAYESPKPGQVQVIDPVLRAQISLAQAQIAYYRSIVDYNKAITEVNFRKGTLLDHDSVYVAESDWEPEAYQQALRRARARGYAFDTKLLHAEPTEFVSGGHAEATAGPLLDGYEVIGPPVEGIDVPEPEEGGALLPPIPDDELSSRWDPAEEGVVQPASVDDEFLPLAEPSEFGEIDAAPAFAE